MPEWPHIILILFAYLIGGISPGYWLTKKQSGIDLRATGSGATGATNAGRVLGKRGFYIVVLLDIAKGMLVTCTAHYAMDNVSLTWQFAAAFFVVVGHIWPVWLGFRGGKGVATFYGAWCALGNWYGFIPLIICFVLSFLLKPFLRRSFKISWLAAHAIFPILVWCVWHNPFPTMISAAMVFVLWIAHRDNIANFIRNRPTPATVTK